VDFDLFANLEAYQEDNASDTTVDFDCEQDEKEKKQSASQRARARFSFPDMVSRHQGTSMYFRPRSVYENDVLRREQDFDEFVEWYDWYYAPRMSMADEPTSPESTPSRYHDDSPILPQFGPVRRGRPRTTFCRRDIRPSRSRSPLQSPPPLTREITAGILPDFDYSSPFRENRPLIFSPETSPLQPGDLNQQN
jgi:hypothetical protein